MKPQAESTWLELRNRVERFIRGRVRDQHLVDDLVQETLLKVHNRMSSLKQEDKLTSWAITIARRSVADAFRGNSQKKELQVEELNVPVSEQNAAIDNELLAAVFDVLLESIPEKYAHAVRRCDFEGVKQADLAKELGLSLSAAKSRVQRGRMLMKAKFLECCELEFDRRGQILDYHCYNREACVFQELPEPQKAKVDCCD